MLFLLAQIGLLVVVHAQRGTAESLRLLCSVFREADFSIKQLAAYF